MRRPIDHDEIKERLHAARLIDMHDPMRNRQNPSDTNFDPIGFGLSVIVAIAVLLSFYVWLIRG
jgi:hypothetical protein